MIITLTGDNEWRIRQEVNDLVARFIKKFGAHSLERIDGETLDVARLPDLLQGTTLFAAHKLVVLNGASKNKPLWEALEAWIAKVPSETTLVVVDGQPDKRTKTYKTLKAKSEFKEFGQPTDAELVVWLQKTAAQAGSALSRQDAQYLLERAGRDQWRLHGEIEKLVGTAALVTRETIDALVEPTSEGSAFDLLDAALAGDTARVKALIAGLKTEEDPYKFFGLLASQVHTLAVVAAAGTRPPESVAKEAGLHPFVVRKASGLARRLGTTTIGHIAADVALCDLQLKSTGAEAWDLVQVCLQKVSARQHIATA